jgi:hypothetical protein
MAGEAAILKAIINSMGESGKTISDADRQRAMDRAAALEASEREFLGESEKTISDADAAMIRMLLGKGSAPSRSMRPRARPFQDGGAVRKKKPKMGCVMKGRGGSYKGRK